MSAARFQVVSVARTAHMPVLREPDAGIGSWAQIPYPRQSGFTWRFMSANNRSLAKPAHTSAGVESCLAAIRSLQENLLFAVGEIARDRMTCHAFLHLVAETAGSATVQAMYR